MGYVCIHLYILNFQILIVFFIHLKRDMNKRISLEEARDIYIKAERLEETFGEHFTAVVSGSSYDEVYNLCKEVIADQAGPIIWVPQKDPL